MSSAGFSLRSLYHLLLAVFVYFYHGTVRAFCLNFSGFGVGEDLIAALEMELAIERGDVEVETITDPDAFRREMYHGDKAPA